MMRAKRGFTLLEVLVTIGLVGLVTGLAGTALVGGIRAVSDLERKARLEVEIGRVERQLRDQLLAINTSPVRRTPLLGTHGSGPSGSDEIDFVTSDLTRSGGIGDVSYKVVTDADGQPVLGYREHLFVYPDNAPADPGAFHPLSAVVVGLDVEYQGDAGFVREWRQDDLPQRIRITLSHRLGRATQSEQFTVEPALVSMQSDTGTTGVTPGASPSAAPSGSAMPLPMGGGMP